MRIILFIGLLLAAGCSKHQQADVEALCGGLHNISDPAMCADYLASNTWSINTAYAAPPVVVNMGDITRSEMVIGELVVDNPLPELWHGYVEFKIIDGGCNGAPVWEILPRQHRTIAASTIADVVGAGGQCGDMPLGPRIAHATVWADDNVTVIGKVIINFRLVE